MTASIPASIVTFATEEGGTVYQTTGFFLENVWLIPLLPALSFVFILFFGKRMPRGGSEVGIAVIGVSFILALLTAGQWIGAVNTAEDHPTEQAHCIYGDDTHADDPHADDTHADDTEHSDDAEDTDHSIGSVLSEGEHAAAVFTEADGEQAVAVFIEADGEQSGGSSPCPVITTTTWWSNGGQNFSVGTLVDGLTVTLLVVVTLVSLLVNIYSTDYVAGDRRYTHFFAFLSLFTAAMLFFVTAENVLQMIVGWELVGVCSFVLIGHWWEEQPNSDAALKAFLTNRVGDMGLLIGMIILFFAAGETFSVFEINSAANSGAISHNLLLIASLCLLAAVMSKSGQFMLHTWLPDAMAGPTPVSALIHAATMVVAGIYMIARMYGVFFNGLTIGGSSINGLAVIGAVTCLFGAMLAFVQDDIKKVLAYSTISQLGYMALALGVGAWTAAVFHLMTHAFFKACLFLGAGSVAHSVHSFDMKKDMGGMRKFMPHTYRTFLIGSLALMGLPPLAGFWSKDEILAGTGGWGLFGGTGGNGAYTFALIMGTLAAMMTAAYMTRTIYLTFFGEFRGHHVPDAHADDAHAVHGDDHDEAHTADGEHHGLPHESGPRIVVPLYILAFLAIVSGFANFPPGFQLVPEGWQERFGHYVEPAAIVGHFPAIGHAAPSWSLAIVATALVLVGAGLSYYYYFVKVNAQSASATGLINGPTAKSTLLKAGHTTLLNRYYLDHIYDGGTPVGPAGANIVALLYGTIVGLTLGLSLGNGLGVGLVASVVWGALAGVAVFAIVVSALRTGVGVASFTKGTFAAAANWFNQHVLDGAVDGIGTSSVRAADFVYRRIDQGIVDGTVNLSGRASSGAGGELRRIQTGKVQQYATLMFAGATVLAGLLIVFN